MATAKGIEITKLDATPRGLMEAGSGTGKLRVFMDTIAAATTDIDDDDVIMLAEVPSNSKIISIKLYNDDLDGGSGLVTDIGLYNGGTKFNDTDASVTAYAAEAVIDRDCYGTLSTDLRAAVTAGTEFRFETLNINTIANFVWEDGGLTSDPGVPLRIALTIETVAGSAAAGDITMVVQYVVN
jgi:hypothetical protein|tara:strand:- start:472 stop:1020 length:549 start_codon:yes stop_codon:yes gene_type:complete